MEYREFRPSQMLSPFIECYWTAHADRPPFREVESLIPDGTIELMFNFGDAYSQVLERRKRLIKGSHVIGIRRETLRISQTDRQDLFSVRFKLGGIYPFFKIPVCTFANDFFGLDDLMGNAYRELEEKLYDCKSDELRVDAAEDYLLSKVNTDAFEQYNYVSRCLRMLIEHPTMDIKSVADRSNTNYRNLERKFETVVGLTPSEVLKIRRFNNAVLSMYSCRFGSLTEIAYDAGYFDQSHFIREFKQLTSLAPREFLKEQFTIVQVIQPALAGRLSKSYNL